MLIFTGYITMAGIQVSGPRNLAQMSLLSFEEILLNFFLQTIIFASASTPGSGGYVPGFKVLVEGISDLSVS